MQQLIIVLHVLVAIGLIALILIQHGKGADIGAAFGSGGSNTVFGSAGSMSFLMKITVTLAAIFFITSIGLTYLVHRSVSQQNSVSPITPATSTTTKTQTTTTKPKSMVLQVKKPENKSANTKTKQQQKQN